MQKLTESEFDLLQDALAVKADVLRKESKMLSSDIMGPLSKLFGPELGRFSEKQHGQNRQLEEDIQLLKAKLISIKREDLFNNGSSEPA